MSQVCCGAFPLPGAELDTELGPAVAEQVTAGRRAAQRVRWSRVFSMPEVVPSP